MMLAKMTVKNQITLPKAVATKFPGVEYFDVSSDGASIILRPLRQSRLGEVQEKLERLGTGRNVILRMLSGGHASNREPSRRL